MGCLGLTIDNFFCWKLKIATIFLAIYVIISATLAMVLEILDIVAYAVPSFEISQGFDSHWRAHVWEGWLACNIVMVCCHLAIIGLSFMLLIAIYRLPTYYELGLTKFYMVMFIFYILTELGTQLYRYAWYGPNTFRRGYLIFTFLYWIIRTIMNVIGCIILHSRVEEIKYEVTYGERKNVGPYASRVNLLEQSMQQSMQQSMRSGTTTPRRM